MQGGREGNGEGEQERTVVKARHLPGVPCLYLPDPLLQALSASAINENEVKFRIASSYCALNESRVALVEKDVTYFVSLTASSRKLMSFKTTMDLLSVVALMMLMEMTIGLSSSAPSCKLCLLCKRKFLEFALVTNISLKQVMLKKPDSIETIVEVIELDSGSDGESQPNTAVEQKMLEDPESWYLKNEEIFTAIARALEHGF